MEERLKSFDKEIVVPMGSRHTAAHIYHQICGRDQLGLFARTYCFTNYIYSTVSQ